MKKYFFSLFLAALMLVEAVPSYAASSACAAYSLEHGSSSAVSINPARLEYRLASGEADRKDLLELYRNFTKDDHHCLLVYPEGRLRSKMLAQSILANRIFVACDPEKEGNKIVSFCKLYIPQGEELLDIVSNEFSAGDFFERSESGIVEFTSCFPAFARDYHLDLASINNFSQPLVEPSSMPYPSGVSSSLYAGFIEQFVDQDVALKLDISRDICIYFGSAFTVKGYKGHGINSTLERFALNTVSLSPEFNAKLQSGASIHYMYGIVSKNFWGSAHLRSFTDFWCCLFGQDWVAASVTMHRAKKPVFEVKEDRAVISASPQTKMLMSGVCVSSDRQECKTPAIVFSDEFIDGFGCFVSCRIP